MNTITFKGFEADGKTETADGRVEFLEVDAESTSSPFIISCVYTDIAKAIVSEGPGAFSAEQVRYGNGYALDNADMGPRTFEFTFLEEDKPQGSLIRATLTFRPSGQWQRTLVDEVIKRQQTVSIEFHVRTGQPWVHTATMHVAFRV